MKPSNRRRRLLGWLALALLVLTPLLVLRTRWAWNEACALAREKLPGMLRMDLDIGRCEIDPLRQGVKLYGVTASVPGRPGKPLLTAESAEVRLGALSPLFGTVQLAMVQLTRPRVFLDLSEPLPSPPGAARACPLDALDKVSLDRLKAHDATVELVLPGRRTLELSAVDLGWEARRGRFEIDLQVGSGVLRQGGGRADLMVGRLSAQAALDPEAQQLQIASAEGTVDDVTFDVGGKVDTLCTPVLDLNAQVFVPLRTLAKVVPLPDKPQGHVLALVTAAGRPDRPNLTADITGARVQLGKLEPGDFTARVTLEGRELQIQDFAFAAGTLGMVHTQATVGLHGNFPIRAQVVLERADLGRILDKVGMKGAWVDLVANGKVVVSGTGHPLQLSGDGEAGIWDLRVTDGPWDAPRTGKAAPRPILELEEARVRGLVQILPDRVELTELEALAGRTHLVAGATLHYAEEKGLVLEGKADALDLSDFGHLAKFDWKGTGSVSFAVRGPYPDPRVAAQLSLKDFSFWDYRPGDVRGELVYERRALRFPAITGQKGKTQYFGSAELDWSREKSGAIRLSLQVPRGRAEDLVDLVAGLHPSVELFQGELLGDAGGSVEIAGPLDRFGGKIDLSFSRLSYYGRALGVGKASLRFRDGAVMELSDAFVDGPSGRLSGEGTFNFAGPLQYRFRGDDLQLAELIGPERAQKLGVTGALQLQGKVEGDREVPVVTGYLASQKVTFADRSLGSTTLNARIVGRELHVWGRPFADATGSLKMTLKAPIPYQLALNLSLPEIRPLLPDGAISQGVSGTLAGTVTARGEVKTRGSDVVQAVVDRLTLTRGDFAGRSAAPVTITYERGKLALDSLVLQGPNTQVSASGWAGPEALEVKLQGRVDVRLLSSFVSGVERAGGEVEVSALASGPLSAPAVLGSARIRDARFSLRDQPLAVRSLSGSIELSDKQVRVESLDGILNDGRVSLSGYVETERFLPRRGKCTRRGPGGAREVPCLEAEIILDGISVRPTEELPFNTSGQLKLSGEPDNLSLSGTLAISRFRYDQPLDLEVFLRDFARARERLVEKSQLQQQKEWLKLNVAVDLDDVRVENNLARTRLQGRVTLTGTNARPGLLGTVEAAEGGQVFFRQNRFDVSELLLDFKERYSMDPVFDLHAQSQVREYLVRLHAFGKPTEPKVILTSEPQLAEADVLSLLTLGVTSRDRSQSNSVEAASYLAAEALFNASGLDREVQRFLPRDNSVVRDLSFHISTSYNDILHQMEPAAQIESRLLTENLKLELTRPFSGRGTRARAEYRLLDGVLVQGQWDNETSTANDLGNFGVDFKLRWEVQ